MNYLLTCRVCILSKRSTPPAALPAPRFPLPRRLSYASAAARARGDRGGGGPGVDALAAAQAAAPQPQAVQHHAHRRRPESFRLRAALLLTPNALPARLRVFLSTLNLTPLLRTLPPLFPPSPCRFRPSALTARQPKIADFCFVHHGEGGRLNAVPQALNEEGYRDPATQLLAPSALTPQHTDVYSFGVILLELITGRRAVVPDPDDADNRLRITEWNHVCASCPKFSYPPPSRSPLASPPAPAAGPSPLVFPLSAPLCAAILRISRVQAVHYVHEGDVHLIADPRVFSRTFAGAFQLLGQIAADCVQEVVEQRPSMRDVRERLLAVEAEHFGDNKGMSSGVVVAGLTEVRVDGGRKD
ncbi:unnamed protein product [Closterium sp. NIES-53]